MLSRQRTAVIVELKQWQDAIGIESYWQTGKIVHESFQRQMDSVLGNDGIHDDCARRQRLIF